jgi:hypothetical protein
MNSFRESQVIWKQKTAFDTRTYKEIRALKVYIEIFWPPAFRKGSRHCFEQRKAFLFR